MKRFRYKDIKVKRCPVSVGATCKSPVRCVFAYPGDYTSACQACPTTYCKDDEDGYNFIQDKSLLAVLFGWMYPRIDNQVESYYKYSENDKNK